MTKAEKLEKKAFDLYKEQTASLPFNQ